MKYQNLNILGFATLLVITFSCAKTNNDTSTPLTQDDLFLFNKNISLKKAEKRKDFYCFNLQTIKSKEVLFCTEAVRGGDILSYDLESQKLIGKINNPTNDIIQGITIINDNEFYIVPKYKNQILRIKNDEIDTILKIGIKEGVKYNLGTMVELFPSKICPLVYHDSVFYVGNMCFSIDNLLNQKFLYGFKVNDDSITVNKTIGEYPHSMIQNDSCLFPFDVSCSFTIHNNEILLSLFTSDSILIKPLHLDTIKRALAKSENIKKLPGFISKEKVNDEKYINRRSITSPTYLGIYYDKYRKLYYRTAKLKSSFQGKDGLVNLSDFNFTIIVLDENFNIIGEQLFSNAKYNATDLIILKNGILLRKQNNFSDSITFSLFNVNQKYLNYEF